MSTELMPNPKQQYFDAAGAPLNGGKVYTYSAGTTTPKATYTNAAGTVQHANPIVLNARGEPASPIFWSGSYKVTVHDRQDNLIYTVDNFVADAAGTLRSDLALATGGTLVSFAQPGPGASTRSVRDKLRERVSVKDFGAVADGATDDTDAIQAAMAASLDVYFPHGTYKVADTGTLFTLRSGQRLTFDNATFSHNSTSGILFSADAVDDWDMEGRWFVTGAGNTAGTAAGLYISGCMRYRVYGALFGNVAGHGIRIDSGASRSPRGDKGRFTNCNAYNCYYGVEITAGGGAEFCEFANFNASLCTFPAVVAAGNTVFNGGNIVDNTNGLYLGSGSNHGHGICSGMQISHNTNYNIKADGVTLGHTFVGCHIYGDSLAGAGKIWFNSSKGIAFVGGHIDAMIQNDGTTGPNYISNSTFPGTYTTKAGTNPENIYINRCSALSGSSSLNDAAPVALYALRSTNQSLSAGILTTAIMDTESVDNRKAYDNTTGAFAVPTSGTQLYRVEVTFTITAASGLDSTCYVEVRNGGATAGYIPAIALSGTLAIASGSVVLAAAAAAVIDVRVKVNGGASTPVLSNAVSSMSITLVS